MGRVSRYKRNDKSRSGFLGHLERQRREWGIVPQRAGEFLVRRGVEVLVFDTRAGEVFRPKKTQSDTWAD